VFHVAGNGLQITITIAKVRQQMVWIKLERSLDYFKKGTWTDVESERNQI
jgi:hypothetical protein